MITNCPTTKAGLASFASKCRQLSPLPRFVNRITTCPTIVSCPLCMSRGNNFLMRHLLRVSFRRTKFALSKYHVNRMLANETDATADLYLATNTTSAYPRAGHPVNALFTIWAFLNKVLMICCAVTYRTRMPGPDTFAGFLSHYRSCSRMRHKSGKSLHLSALTGSQVQA